MNKQLTYSFAVDGDYSQLALIRSEISSKAKEFGFSENDVSKIVLAVDEACSNLIRHSFKFANAKQINVEIIGNDDQFYVKIIDDGVPFNPLNVQMQDMVKYFSEFKSGGLGIHIIKMVMDEISYLPSEGNPHKNILTLRKQLHANSHN